MNLLLAGHLSTQPKTAHPKLQLHFSQNNPIAVIHNAHPIGTQMKTTITLITLLAAFTLSNATAAPLAPSTAGTDEVTITLIAEHDKASPGEQVWLGVRQKIKPEWHTYWRNPGESGIGTSIKWTLPDGVRVGEIQWPTPHRIKQGDIINYGYEDSVTLLSALTIPRDAAIGSSIPVEAKVNWLVCKDVCIPQQTEVALSLNVVAPKTERTAANAHIRDALTSLPTVAPWTISAQSDGKRILLTIKDIAASEVQSAMFIPQQQGWITDLAEQVLSVEQNQPTLNIQSSDTALTKDDQLSGVLTITSERNGVASTLGYTFSAPVEVVAAGSLPVPKVSTVKSSKLVNTNDSADLGIALALLFAFLGGVILNLMPCVFPVLSLKALSLAKHAHADPLATRLHGVLYAAGVLVSFTLLGIALLVLKAGGSQVGWGFQFQSPLFVLVVAYLIFTVGLNLSGVFTAGSSFAGIGSKLADRGGYSGSFFTGVLAVIVATPCTAPLMGGAISYALAQPAFVLIAVLLAMGVGLALPYLLLSFFPVLQRALPRPGAWMERMKQALAFPMYATAIWLVWVLTQQAGANAAAIALTGMLSIAFAAWLFTITRLSQARWRHAATAAAIALLALALIGGYKGIQFAGTTTQATAAHADSEPYTAARLQALRAEGKPVFINLTAAWCITCLVNERVALSSAEFKATLEEKGITYLKGDWTNQDPEISALLSEFGRSGVPLYVFYPAGKDSAPVVLPQLLTPQVVTASFGK
jgi:thiol:disulfide interchange protein